MEKRRRPTGRWSCPTLQDELRSASPSTPQFLQKVPGLGPRSSPSLPLAFHLSVAHTTCPAAVPAHSLPVTLRFLPPPCQSSGFALRPLTSGPFGWLHADARPETTPKTTKQTPTHAALPAKPTATRTVHTQSACKPAEQARLYRPVRPAAGRSGARAQRDATRHSAAATASDRPLTATSPAPASRGAGYARATPC